MNSKAKNELISEILANYIPGRRFALSYIIPVNERVRMAEAEEIVLELERKGLVSKCISTFEDLIFTVNSELKTFAERGGFEAEDIMYEAEIQKVILEISKLESEMDPCLYNKIMKILEPLATFAGTAINVAAVIGAI